MLAALEPRGVELFRAERGRRAAVREHRALAVVVDERADDPASALGRADDLDPAGGETASRELTGVVRAPLADEPRAGAELGRPGRDVRRLAAGREVRLRRCVRARRHRPTEPHDDVERQVAEGADEHGEDRKI